MKLKQIMKYSLANKFALSLIYLNLFLISCFNSSAQECELSQLPTSFLSHPSAHAIPLDINESYVLYNDLWFDRDIYRYDFDTVFNISKAHGNTSSENVNGRMDGEKVVWQGFENNSNHIYLYELDKTIEISSQFIAPITDNLMGDVHDGKIVWSGNRGGERHIYLYEDGIVTEISSQFGNTSTDNQEPRVDNNRIVWTGFDGTRTHVYSYNKSQVKKISSFYSETLDYNNGITISESRILWSGFEKDTMHLYLYEDNSVINISKLYGNKTEHNFQPSYSEGRIAWSGHDGETWHIYLYDGNSIEKITDHERVRFNDELSSNFTPNLVGNNLVWAGKKIFNRSSINIFNGEEIQTIDESRASLSAIKIFEKNIAYALIDEGRAFLQVGQSCITPSSRFPDSNPIPALSEWLTIILGLSLLIISVMFLKNSFHVQRL